MLRLVEDCVICERRAPADLLCDLDRVWVTAGTWAPLPGYVCVIAKEHVREPYELPAPDAAAFWASCMAVAEAVSGLLQPKKMNYEIHGNTVPHLHMHLFPRFDGDPFEGGPIDGRRATFERSHADLLALAEAISSR